MSDNKPGFETLLGELESIVSELEAGTLSLEKSMQQYERGVTIVKNCQQALNKATQKIEKLNIATNQTEAWQTQTDIDDSIS